MYLFPETFEKKSTVAERKKAAGENNGPSPLAEEDEETWREIRAGDNSALLSSS